MHYSILLLLSSLPVFSTTADLKKLYLSLVDRYDAFRPAYVLRADFSNINENDLGDGQTYSYSSEARAEALADHLMFLKDSGQVDLVFFAPGNHGDLLRALDTKEPPFFNSKVNAFLPAEAKDLARVQLNTRIVFYGEKGDVSLWEEYSILNQATVRNEVGFWDVSSSALYLPEPNIWERRKNLHGVTLRNGVLSWGWYSQISADNGTGEWVVTHIEGIFFDILDQLATHLNFSAAYVRPPDGNWGGIPADGETWTGIVGMLVNRTLDISTAGLVQNYERSQVIDFSMPLERVHYTLMRGASDEDGRAAEPNFWVYLRVFGSDAWAACAASVASTSVGLYAIRRFGRESYGFLDFGLSDALALPMLAHLGINFPVHVRALSARILVPTVYLGAFVVFAFYTSDLTAILIAQPADDPIRTFDEAVRRGYRFAVVKDAYSHSALKHALPGTSMRKTYYALIHDNPASYLMNFDKAIEAILADRKLLFYNAAEVAAHDLRVLPLSELQEQHRGFLGFGFQKDSELTEFFDYHLRVLMENGVVHAIKKSYKEEALIAKTKHVGSPVPVAIGYERVLFLFCTVAVGAAGSLCLSAVEKLTRRRKLYTLTIGT